MSLNEIGINIGLMIGGFFGSLITIKKKRSIKEQLLSVVTGTMSANYLSPVIIEYMSLEGSFSVRHGLYSRVRRG